MFETSQAYYGTLFHELVYSTGHESRSNRPDPMDSGEFASKMYSKEELTAECGRCFLASFAGITLNCLVNQVAYIQAWLISQGAILMWAMTSV